MNEDRFGIQIRNLLNRSATALDERTLTRLRAAREKAVAHQRVAQPELVPAWAGRVLGPLGPFGSASRWLVPLAFALLAIIGFQYWTAAQGDDLAELDTAVLKGDLPIDAYLDQGFQSWLKRSTE